MKKILVPTDFSKPAEWALETAINIAQKANGQIILLHVVEQSGNDSFNVEGQVSYNGNWEDKLFTMKLIEKGKLQLAEAGKKVNAAAIPVDLKLRFGNPFHGIKDTITANEVDLIVMGTSGHSAIEEMILGSNTEKVVRYAKSPVLTVHKRPSSYDFKNIVYASSLDDKEESFADVVRNAQEMYQATVHLVRINTPANFQPDHIVKKVMEDFARKIKLANYTINIFNDVTEEEGIIHFASSINADLIAMATHGRTGFAHVLAGSIAEDVANHAAQPVLTFVTAD